MGNSRNIVAQLKSENSPLENLDGIVSKTFTQKICRLQSVLILPRSEAFKGIVEKMSFDEYYFHHCYRINFIRMTQAILSETVTKNRTRRHPLKFHIWLFKASTQLQSLLDQN
jgi:hypothetical protein